MFPNVPIAVRRRMARIGKVNTKPEVAVRRVIHKLGYRFRLHNKGLPGTPDIVLPRLKVVVLVHGCFWHRHDCLLAGRVPMTRTEYWMPKLARNVERDMENRHALARLGWKPLVIWECEIGNKALMERKVRRFLDRANASSAP